MKTQQPTPMIHDHIFRTRLAIDHSRNIAHAHTIIDVSCISHITYNKLKHTRHKYLTVPLPKLPQSLQLPQQPRPQQQPQPHANPQRSNRGQSFFSQSFAKITLTPIADFSAKAGVPQPAPPTRPAKETSVLTWKVHPFNPVSLLPMEAAHGK